MREDVDFRLGEAAAVDDAGVVQFVGNDVVFRPQNGSHRAGVGREAGLEHHRGLHVLEAGDALLQLHVHRHGAGDGAYRARTDTVLAGGLHGGLVSRGWVVSPR